MGQHRAASHTFKYYTVSKYLAQLGLRTNKAQSYVYLSKNISVSLFYPVLLIKALSSTRDPFRRVQCLLHCRPSRMLLWLVMFAVCLPSYCVGRKRILRYLVFPAVKVSTYPTVLLYYLCFVFRGTTCLQVQLGKYVSSEVAVPIQFKKKSLSRFLSHCHLFIYNSRLGTYQGTQVLMQINKRLT